jgi:hypothetical protein
MRIIKSSVDRLTYEKSGRAADYRWDDQLKGFGVRIYPSGRCAFVVTYRTETGTKKFLTLGNYGNLTVDEARRLAKDKLHDVQHGRDPQTERQEKRHEMTFDELADRYLDHFKARKRSDHAKRNDCSSARSCWMQNDDDPKPNCRSPWAIPPNREPANRYLP